MERTDKQLIRNFLEGNDESFEYLVKKHLKAVYNFLYQLTKDMSLADDLTQETFFKAWKNIRRFDPEKNFKAWLFTIAKNSAYDAWKKKKTLPFSLFENSEGYNKLDEIVEEKPLPDELLEQIGSAEELEEKMKKLSKKYRTILLLHYKEDFSLAEIAAILSIPYNTIKSQHKRALNALKKELLHP